MRTISISIPSELTSTLDKHPEISWENVSKQAILQHLKKVAFTDFIDDNLANSKFTERDSEALSKKLKHERVEKLKEQGRI